MSNAKHHNKNNFLRNRNTQKIIVFYWHVEFYFNGKDGSEQEFPLLNLILLGRMGHYVASLGTLL